MADIFDSDDDFAVTSSKTTNSKPRASKAKSKTQTFQFSDSDLSDGIVEDETVPKPKKAAAPKKKAASKKTPLSEVSANGGSKPSSKSSKKDDEDDDFDMDDVDDKENNIAPNGTSKKDASSQYQKLTQLEHILKRPDTYIGSVEPTESKMWIFNAETKSMEYKDVTIVPGLYKIFDEILVNAADNKIRDPKMDRLDVTIDAEANTISVKNNGKGIPIEIHKKEKIYIPELIFGNLLTSSNYDDDEKKVTGGRNGYGAKVCVLFTF